MISLLWLGWLPVLTYVVSYLYLTGYQHKFFLFHTVIHEGGTYTLLQTIFYASHFLGHVPMLTVLAFVFTGAALCLSTPQQNSRLRHYTRSVLGALFLFLCGTMILGVKSFGWADTWAFISQQKQSVVTYVQGGAWNLHLPSTVLQLFLIPVYLYVVRKIFRCPISLNNAGAPYLWIGILLLVLGTVVMNRNNLGMVLSLWHDSRYLAHSVRELVTFPLIFYPLPLYVILKYAQASESPASTQEGRLWVVMLVLAAIFLVGICCQAWLPLHQGIGTLAQKPGFARGGELNVAYLLASHYFEHFLDTIYFALLCLLLYFGGDFRRQRRLRP